MPDSWSPPTLGDLVAPMTETEFLETRYQRSWLLSRGADDRFHRLYGWDDVNALLKHGRLEPPLLRLVRWGRPVDENAYSRLRRRGASGRLEHRGIVPALLHSQLRAGATLVISEVSEASPRLDEFCRALERRLLTSVNINLYAGWRRDSGFTKHWDNHDVFILQLSGRKDWELYPDTRPHPLQNDPAVRVVPGDVVWKGTLTPGDCLYIPRGWWHVAYPLDEPSLHLTTGMTTVSGETVLEWLSRRLMAWEDFRADVPLVGGPGAVGARLRSIAAAAADALGEGAAEDFMEYAESACRASLDTALPDAPANDQPPGPPVRLELAVSGSPRVRDVAGGAGVSFATDRRTRRYPAGARPLLEALAAGHRGTVPQLAALCAPDMRPGAAGSIVSRLFRDGVIRLVPSDAGRAGGGEAR